MKMVIVFLLGAAVALLLHLCLDWSRHPSSIVLSTAVAIEGTPKTSPFPGGVTVDWQTTQSCPTILRIGRERRETAASRGDRRHHRLVVDNLVPGQRYSMQAVFPDGSRSLPFTATAGAEQLELVEGRRDGPGLLTIAVRCLPRRPLIVVVERQSGREAPRTLEPREDGLVRFDLDSTSEAVLDVHLQSSSAASLPSHSLRRIVSEECHRLVSRLEGFSPAAIVGDETRELLQSIQSFTAEIERIDSVERAEAGHRREKQRVAAASCRIRRVLSRRLEESSFVPHYRRLSQLAPLFFETSLLSVRSRLQAYHLTRPWVELLLHTAFSQVELTSVPFPALGPFGCRDGELQVGPAGKVSSRTLIAQKTVFGVPGPFSGSAAQSRWQGSFALDDLAVLAQVELVFLVRTSGYAALRVKVNDGPYLLLHHVPYLGSERRRTIACGVPLHYLRAGRNELELVVDGVLGRTLIPFDRCRVHSLQLRTKENALAKRPKKRAGY